MTKEAQALAEPTLEVLAEVERDYARESLRDLTIMAKQHAAQTKSLHDRIAVLEKALEPFAKAADIRLCGEWRDDERFGQTDVSFHLTFGDLRKARAAYDQKDQEA